MYLLLIIEWSAEVQAQQVTEKKLLVVMVEFSDAATNDDARGSRGRTGANTFEEFKYRYKDYYDIFFQTSGAVLHPDASLDPDFSVEKSGWSQYGSFTRYIHDNSFGLWEIVPLEVDRANDQFGILNTVDYDGDPELQNAKINWLKLDMAKPNSGDSQLNGTIANAAFVEMESILPPNWDWADVDAVKIIYAGAPIEGAGGSKEIVDADGIDVTCGVYAERSSMGCFNAPLVWFHELVHAVTGSNVDLYYDHTGRYSVMGASLQNAYTPSLLDPWLRITLGWLDFEVRDTAGEWTNVELPKVSARDNGDLPWVLVVPITGDNPATSDWGYIDKSYLIVENRRIEGWDRQLNRDDNSLSPTFGQVITGIDGGFLVWGAGTLAPGRLRPYEADGDYDIDYGTNYCGDPYDFFPFGGAQFGVWTKPGLIDRWDDFPALCENRRTRNVFMSFPQYTTTTNRNSIGRLSLDRLVVEAHTYDSSPISDISATKYNNQQKTCWFDGNLHLGFNVNGIAYVARSSDAGSSWRDLFVMTSIIGNGNLRSHENDDNVSLTATSSGVWVLTEEWHADFTSYLVRRQLTPEECEYNKRQMSAPSGSALRPGIAALDDFIVYVSPHNTGIGTDPAGLYAWQSTDGGNNWTGPIYLTGTTIYARNPSVSVRKVDKGGGQFDYYYDVIFGYADNGVRWYSSASLTTASITSTSTANYSPTHIEHDAILDIACVEEIRPDQELEYVINFLRFRTSGGHYQQPVNVMHTQDNEEVKRDPRIITTEDDDGVKHLITWVEGAGNNMYFADNHDNPNDWSKIHRSSFTLIPSLTSYPLAVEGANGESMIGSTVVSNALSWPLSLWQVEMKTRAQDITDHAVLLDVVTGKTVVLESNGLRQELRHLQPTVHDGVGQEIGAVRYAFNAPLMYWTYSGGTPFDSLTTTEEVTLVGSENVRYSIRVVSDIIPDTTFVEGYLYDHASGGMISTSGEYRIPPGVLDTTLTLGLELPSGVPMATVRIHTNAWRGLMDPLKPCQLTLSRDHYGSEPAAPKVRSREILQIAGCRDALQLYPTETRTGGMLTMMAPFSGPVTVRIHSMLGQEVTRTELSSAENGTHISLRLPMLRPGMYVVSATGEADIRTARILVQ